MSRFIWLAVLVALASLEGCAKPGPDISPVPDISQRACPPRADLLDATPLSLASRKEKTATVDITFESPCFRDSDGQNSLYHAFGLPSGDMPLKVLVQSLPTGSNLMAPRAILLDGLGQLSREIPADSFLFRGAALSALIGLRPGEKTLLVASAANAVGRPIDRITGRLDVTSYGAGKGAGQWVSGSESASHQITSHSGRIVVSVEAMPADK